jgi:hypothetical protein
MMSLNEQRLLQFAATLDDASDAAFVRAIASAIARLHMLAQFYGDTVQELRQPPVIPGGGGRHHPQTRRLN